jgi:hypothetical protein
MLQTKKTHWCRGQIKTVVDIQGNFATRISEDMPTERSTAFNKETSANSMKNFVSRRSKMIIFIIANVTCSTSVNAEGMTTG